MTTTYYIGADVHSNSTELAIEKRGKIVARYSVPTSIPAIVNVLAKKSTKCASTSEQKSIFSNFLAIFLTTSCKHRESRFEDFFQPNAHIRPN